MISIYGGVQLSPVSTKLTINASAVQADVWLIVGACDSATTFTGDWCNKHFRRDQARRYLLEVVPSLIVTGLNPFEAIESGAAPLDMVFPSLDLGTNRDDGIENVKAHPSQDVVI